MKNDQNYLSPKFITVDISIEGVLCQSDPTPDPIGNHGGFEPDSDNQSYF